MTHLLPAPLLKFALRLDATASFVLGVITLSWLGSLPALVGASHSAVFGAGLVMVVYGSALGWLCTRVRLAEGLVWFIAIGNLLWTLASVLLIASDWITPTRSGVAILVAQTMATALFSALQYQGLRRSQEARI